MSSFRVKGGGASVQPLFARWEGSQGGPGSISGRGGSEKLILSWERTKKPEAGEEIAPTLEREFGRGRVGKGRKILRWKRLEKKKVS